MKSLASDLRDVAELLRATSPAPARQVLRAARLMLEAADALDKTPTIENAAIQYIACWDAGESQEVLDAAFDTLRKSTKGAGVA